jgi:hypothetical protein
MSHGKQRGINSVMKIAWSVAVDARVGSGTPTHSLHSDSSGTFTCPLLLSLYFFLISSHHPLFSLILLSLSLYVYYATSWKVAGSIPDEVIAFFT